MAKKILIIDDDTNLLRLLESAFKSKGYETVSFSKGAEGKAFLENEANLASLNLVVLDRILPDVEGIEILKAFEQKNQGKIPVIILSSLSSEKDVMEGLGKGARDYLTKPFNASVLLHKAEQLMR